MQVNDFLQKSFGHNATRRHTDFKCYFDLQDPRKPIRTRKLYKNCKCYPLMKHILSVLHFALLLGCALSDDRQTIGSQVIHVDNMRISYKNEGDGFQADALCDQIYTYTF